jgi:hypothetical protein
VKMGTDAGQSGAEELRGNDGDDDPGFGGRGFVSGNSESRGNRKAGKEEDVFMLLGNLPGLVGAVGPERDLVAAAAVKRKGNGGSPCPGT